MGKNTIEQKECVNGSGRALSKSKVYAGCSHGSIIDSHIYCGYTFYEND